MSDENRDHLAEFSSAIVRRTAAARPLVAEIRLRGHRPRSGTLWRPDAVIASEQALPRTETAEIVLSNGQTCSARLAGRDAGTNVAVLRIDGAPAPGWSLAEEPQPGAMVLALAADNRGGSAARLGIVHSVGPAWISRAGGRIDRRIGLDMRLSRLEEGGPVLDMAGGLLGISTLAPRRRVLVIPTATIERVLEPLLTTGRVARGWLGLAVQPVTVPEHAAVSGGQRHGLMVVDVTRDGPAARAGVMMGDILLALDGVAITGTSNLAEVLGAETVGKDIELRLIRAGQVQSVKATLGERPVR